MAREASLAFCGDITVHLFSSLSGLGLKDVESTLDQWFEFTDGFEERIIES
jgi:GTP-binding protein